MLGVCFLIKGAFRDREGHEMDWDLVKLHGTSRSKKEVPWHSLYKHSLYVTKFIRNKIYTNIIYTVTKFIHNKIYTNLIYTVKKIDIWLSSNHVKSSKSLEGNHPNVWAFIQSLIGQEADTRRVFTVHQQRFWHGHRREQRQDAAQQGQEGADPVCCAAPWWPVSHIVFANHC